MTMLTIADIQKKRKECFYIKGRSKFDLIQDYLSNNNCHAVTLAHLSETTQKLVSNSYTALYDFHFIIEGEMSSALVDKLYEIGMKVKKAKNGTYFQG